MKSKILALGVILTVFLTACGPVSDIDPKKIVKDGFKNLNEMETGMYELLLEGDIQGKDGEEMGTVSFVMNINGVIDGSDEKKPKFSMDVDGAMDSDDYDSQKLSLGIRTDGDFFYVYLGSLPNFSGDFPSELLMLVSGKWWQIPIPEESKDQFGEKDEDDMTEDEKALKELMKNTEFFKNIKYEGIEDVRGTDCYKFEAEADREAIQSFVALSAEVQGQSLTGAQLSQLAEFLKNTDLPVTVWISVEDTIMRKIGGELAIEGEDGGSFDMDFELTLYDLGEDLAVLIPVDTTLFDPETFLQGMMGGMQTGLEDMGGAEMPGEVDVIKMNGLEDTNLLRESDMPKEIETPEGMRGMPSLIN
jgi:hypothetical protein